MLLHGVLAEIRRIVIPYIKEAVIRDADHELPHGLPESVAAFFPVKPRIMHYWQTRKHLVDEAAILKVQRRTQQIFLVLELTIYIHLIESGVL